MFTGIVEELGTVASVEGSRLRLWADVVLGDARLGDSIAVNGCCLTLVDQGVPPSGGQAPEGATGWWEADVSDETWQRTCLGDLVPGDRVNLERPVRLVDRLGGHLVQGHVDGVGTITAPAPDLAVSMPPALARYVVEKGSITVDGVSLTVVDALPDGFTVALIPLTAELTTLGRKGIGHRVNLEVDVMAKYAERLLAGHLPAPHEAAAAGPHDTAGPEGPSDHPAPPGGSSHGDR
jgi:riboflavin synthase